ncbi:MAG: hypothetical protein AMXMBFR66_31720 [Pseudomonadota bacterium]|nr:hypothetical protein [Rubrivivax sp.]NLZ41907.1 hypothetical protein [Comamonadaceae bacterium]
MAPAFDAATLAPDDRGARATVTPGRASVFFHLARGFDLGAADAGREPGEAVAVRGSFVAAGGGAQPTAGWDFGFVQLTKMVSGQAYYAGRLSREGSIAVMFENAMPARLLLDSLDDRSPWTRRAPRFAAAAGRIECRSSDHPTMKLPRKLRNSLRNVDNFLFHAVDERLFWTVLTAIETSSRRRHHLAHLHWRVHHDVKFQWRGGEPMPMPSRGRGYELLRNVRGAPPEAELQALLADPQPPQFNPASSQALLQAFLGARGANRSENAHWFMNVPSDFYA